jgi:hypothetical protein
MHPRIMQHVPNISGLENAPLQTQAMIAKWFQQEKKIMSATRKNVRN